MSLLGPREGRAGSRLFSVFHGPEATASHVADATQEAGFLDEHNHGLALAARLLLHGRCKSIYTTCDRPEQPAG